MKYRKPQLREEETYMLYIVGIAGNQFFPSRGRTYSGSLEQIKSTLRDKDDYDDEMIESLFEGLFGVEPDEDGVRVFAPDGDVAYALAKGGTNKRIVAGAVGDVVQGSDQ